MRLQFFIRVNARGDEKKIRRHSELRYGMFRMHEQIPSGNENRLSRMGSGLQTQLIRLKTECKIFVLYLLQVQKGTGRPMMYDFNAEEIFKMAEEIEKNGARFYRNAAENVSESRKKNLLIHLAEMEDEHEKLFSTLRKALTDSDKKETIFDPEDDSTLYLKALADTRVFFQKTLDFSSMEKILKGAIEAEKDSIVFYLGMKKAVPDELGKNRIENIIQEEMGHIRILSKELLALK